MSAPSKETSDSVAELKKKGRDEPVASFLGMKLVELTPGYARVTMKLKPEYLNFNGYVFGGIVTAIADQAFAYASNTLAYPSVASQFNVHFISGPATDDELVAECRVVHSGHRVGISEMTVTNQDGKLIARATGTTVPIGDD